MNRFLLVCIITFVCLVGETKAQGSDRPAYKKSYYAWIGYGWGGHGYAFGYGTTIQITKGSIVGFSLQGTRKAKTQEYPLSATTSPVKQTTSVILATQYGKIWKRHWGHGTLSGGPSLVSATRFHIPSGDPLSPEYYTGTNHLAIGVYTEASIYSAWKFAGIGVRGFLTLNGAFSHGGITLNAAIGRINYKRKA